MMGISKEQALDCLRSADLIGIGMEADAVRRNLHPENMVSYAVEIVTAPAPGFLEEAKAAGASSVRLAIPSAFTFAGLEAAIKETKRFSALQIHGPSTGVLLRLADASGLSAEQAISRLRDAGLSSFAGDDLGSGDEPDRLLDLHRCAHRAGTSTTAGMVFGAGESLEDRVEHLFAIRELQEETGGFTSFTPLPFVAVAGPVEAPTAVEYMRTLAVARIVLDNIANIECNCLAQGLKVVQMALRFGANDAGTIHAGGMKNFTEEDLRRVIRDAGFRPVERDTLYTTMFLNN